MNTYTRVVKIQDFETSLLRVKSQFHHLQAE
jgi:hypothetical protein